MKRLTHMRLITFTVLQLLSSPLIIFTPLLSLSFFFSPSLFTFALVLYVLLLLFCSLVSGFLLFSSLLFLLCPQSAVLLFDTKHNSTALCVRVCWMSNVFTALIACWCSSERLKDGGRVEHLFLEDRVFHFLRQGGAARSVVFIFNGCVGLKETVWFQVQIKLF